ncbi:melanocyte-stimulating hormone receptor-like [Saccostrea echinata]|uniref:melanocyte-stimulating hormone receptor-like n=1 Tax=Saccostrea echinata TaxID=191078 RepID=UPI002A835299|nr:melanocyte-stimulating hormone receptor-like [Saccostrea echinata]
MAWNGNVEDLLIMENNRSLPIASSWDNLTYNKIGRNTSTISLVTLVIAILLLITGMFGNFFTIILIFLKKKLHTPTYTCIACLGIADALASCSRFVLLLHNYFGIFNYYEEIAIYIIIVIFFLHAANLHIVLFAYLRCELISSPLQSVEITCRKVLRISIVIWVLSAAMAFAYGTVITLELTNIVTHVNSFLTDFVLLSYIYFLPLFLIVFFHIKKIRTLRQKQYQSKRTNTPTYTHMSHSMSIMFIIIIVIFIFSSTPLYIHVIMVYVCAEGKSKYVLCIWTTVSYSISNLCVMLNNCINPIIYFMFSTPARKFLNRCRTFWT